MVLRSARVLLGSIDASSTWGLSYLHTPGNDVNRKVTSVTGVSLAKQKLSEERDAASIFPCSPSIRALKSLSLNNRIHMSAQHTYESLMLRAECPPRGY